MESPKGIKAGERLARGARAALAREIALAGGGEVFALGKVGDSGLVEQVEVLARGDENRVPAILNIPRSGEVVIHNHPGGDLRPSKPDLDIAAALGSDGVGFYIIDCRAERLYEVVKAFQQKQEILLDEERIAAMLRPQGAVASTIEDFESRPAQIEMVRHVVRAFNDRRILVIEAGTGTGKSLAYLIPAILWATNNQERVVISTNTINLQEQIISKDLPLLAGKAGLNFKAVLVKGRSNYLCRRKAGALRQLSLGLTEQDRIVGAILEWAAATTDGTVSDLSFQPPSEIWEEFMVEADQCNRIRCPYYGSCFFFEARRAAAASDILVSNHHILMADLSLRDFAGISGGLILPNFNRVVVDEAHHIEDVATSFFGHEVSRMGILRSLGRICRKGGNKGFAMRLFRSLRTLDIPQDRSADLADFLSEDLIGHVMNARDLLGSLFDAIAHTVFEQLGARKEARAEVKLRIKDEFLDDTAWRDALVPAVLECRSILDELQDKVGKLSSMLGAVSHEDPGPLEDFILEAASSGKRLATASQTLALFVQGLEDHCRWIEVKGLGRGLSVRLCQAPLFTGDLLKKTLMDAQRSVIMTSATLAVGKRFDYFHERVGIDPDSEERLDELILDPPFDFANRVFLGMPRDVPEPDTEAFPRELAQLIERTLRISQGRAFVLFTSYALLNRIYAEVQAPARDLGFACLKQGDASRHFLLDRFRKEGPAVLFGTDSFWEGVDVRGEALSCVVLTRLPFRVPTEPILEARMNRIQLQGGDPFKQFLLPQAVIKFKQGFGRLIRHRDDRGAVMVFDSRLHRRYYGRVFLASLPETRRSTGPREAVFEAMERFFSGQGQPLPGDLSTAAGAAIPKAPSSKRS